MVFFSQGDRIFLFGGTSPYDGPQIVYTEQQMELMPEMLRDGEAYKLLDHSDLFVLDLDVSLKNLCIEAVTNNDSIKWQEELLPTSLLDDLSNTVTRNQISQPVKTNNDECG